MRKVREHRAQMFWLGAATRLAARAAAGSWTVGLVPVDDGEGADAGGDEEAAGTGGADGGGGTA